MKYFIFKNWLKDALFRFPQKEENSEILEIALFTYCYFNTQVFPLLRPILFEYAYKQGYTQTKRKYRFVRDIVEFIKKES